MSKHKRNQQQIIEERRKNTVRWVMSNPLGREFVYDLIFGEPGFGGCDLMNVYPSGDSGLNRHEGRRAVGQERVIELGKVCPEQYIQMISERLSFERTQRLVDEASEPGEENEDG